MTDSQGEVSEVDSLTVTAQEFSDADDAPTAEYANQTADGAPKNYGDVAPDDDLPPA